MIEADEILDAPAAGDAGGPQGAAAGDAGDATTEGDEDQAAANDGQPEIEDPEEEQGTDQSDDEGENSGRGGVGKKKKARR